MNPEDVADRLRGALEGRDQVLQVLGEGGMAVVFLALDLKHERQVAIKVLRPDGGFEIGGTRFLQEIRVTAQLSHAHIVPLLDSGEADVLLFFVMPLVQGETLRARLQRERQLPVGVAMQIATQVAGALAHAHARGILHRDIKPENVMLSDGQALVTDFGIARAIAAGDDAAHTATGLAVGTPAYMSPEQVSGERMLDARSDLYSLACVTYELLVGEPPFTGPTAHAILARRLTETPRPIRAARKSVNPAIEAVIARALSRLPADRQDSVEQFASELRAAAGAVEVTPNRAWRGRVLALTAVLALAGMLIWQRTRNTESSAGNAAGPVRLAVLPLENLGGGEDAPFTHGMTEEIMSRLAEIGALQVVSRTSARRFRGTSLSMREVGTELGADYVLEGTVRTDRGGAGGGTARVAARLIRAADDVRVWQQTFDAALVPGEILIVQAGIATQVAAALNVSLGTGEERRVTRVTTPDSAAYRLYQLGRFQWEKRDAASLQQAINHFRDAVTRDPAFADAHAGMSDAIGASILLYGDGDSASYHENRRLALAAARRAVALDSALAAAHASLGFGLFFFEWDFGAAEQSFTRAIRSDPEYGPARYWYTQPG